MTRNTEVDPVRDSSDLTTDPSEIARVESQNALEQFDYAMYVVGLQMKSKDFSLQRDIIYELNRLATKGIKANAGKPRQVPVSINGSDHVPPAWEDVTDELAFLCKYVNDHWEGPPIHLAAYILWRINWIHPFEDGNGRTARMLSYMVLCIRLGFVLPGAKTIPEQIASNKAPYYGALESADAAFKKNVTDLRVLETLLSELLANQLYDIHEQAVGPAGTTGP